MEKYENLSGNAGILAFKIEEEAIIVKFSSGEIYTYRFEKPGKAHVEKMKQMAEDGRGLSTYISQNVKSNYQKKERF